LTPLITLNQEKEEARRKPGFLLNQRMAISVHKEVRTHVFYFEYFACFCTGEGITEQQITFITSHEPQALLALRSVTAEWILFCKISFCNDYPGPATTQNSDLQKLVL